MISRAVHGVFYLHHRDILLMFTMIIIFGAMLLMIKQLERLLIWSKNTDLNVQVINIVANDDGA
jgi:hypothetical protein